MGPTRIVAIRPPPPAASVPSSNVTTTSVWAKAGFAVIGVTKRFRKKLPVATEQSCISWHMFGTTSVKLAAVGEKWRKSLM